jgi:cell wall assembly regulator SMI1
VLAVFAAVAVLVAGVVIVVMSTSSPQDAGSGPDRRLSAFVTAVEMTTGLPASATSVPSSRRPRPTLTVDSGCRLGQGPARLADVSTAVSDRVNRVWERVEKWLSANAPETAATLAPPASAEQILAAQRQTGVPFPPELIASLRRHNGTGTNMRDGFTLPPFYLPLSAEGIVGEAKVMCDVLGSVGIDGNVGSWWHGQVIPIAFDGGGGNLLLDQRPGRGGRLGDHSEESEMRFERYPRTLTELLELTARSLETRSAVLEHYRPKVVAGALDWDIG